MKKDNLLNYCLDLKSMNRDLNKKTLSITEYETLIDIYKNMLQYHREGDSTTTTSLFQTLICSKYFINYESNQRNNKIENILE